MSRRGSQIDQQHARGEACRLIRFRSAKGLGECGNALEQQLALRLGGSFERSSTRTLQRKAFEQLRQFIGCQRAPRHAVNNTYSRRSSRTRKSTLPPVRASMDGLWDNRPMTTGIARLLGAFGLAPVSQVQQLNGDVRRTEAKIAQLEQKLEEVRADASNWKRRYEDTTEAVSGWKQATHRAQAETELMKRDADRIKAELERVKAELEREQPRTAEERRRVESLKAELQGMRARVENAHRVTDSANEQLIAMEVKLDLIEAAIQVLDTRTREQAVSSAR